MSVSGYLLILCMISPMVSGCVVNRTVGVNPSLLPSETSAGKAPDKKDDSKNGGKTKKATSVNTIRTTASGDVGAVKKKRKQDESRFDRQLREAADKLAVDLGQIKAMKLCYVNRDNEWWVILYRDIGPVIDVMNYIWNWEEQKFKRYLIVKRIPKNELREAVIGRERGRNCEILKHPGGKPESERPQRDIRHKPRKHKDTKETGPS